MHDNTKYMDLTSASKEDWEVEESVNKAVDSLSKNNAYKQHTVQKVTELES